MSSNDIHVWLAILDPPDMRVQQISQSLIEDERIKAERFYFERDRKRFMVCRGVLRMILGRYLHIEANRVQFSYGPYGKPYSKETLGDSTLRFNLAHSHELALYAFARSREIGVDIEYIRYLPDAEQIALNFFSENENAVLHVLPTSQKQEAFSIAGYAKKLILKHLELGCLNLRRVRKIDAGHV